MPSPLVRLVASILLVLLALPAVAAERLVLSTGMREPWTNDNRDGFTNLMVAELFRRLGMEAEVVFNPAAARALQLAEDGTDDGLAARIAGLEDKYPNLLRVPEPIFINDFVAASLPSMPAEVKEWSDLSPFAVGYIIGWQIFEKNLPQVKDLTLVKDSRQLLSLLKAGRTDIILHERWQALWHATQLNVPLAIHDPPLAAVPMYLYLHRRHAPLVEPAAAQLRAMRDDGTYKTIADRAFSSLAPAKRPQ